LDPQWPLPWLFSGVAHVRLRQHQQAIECLTRAADLGYEGALLAESLGDAHFGLGDMVSALRLYFRAARLSPGRSSIESKLGLVEVRCGRTSSGLARMRCALEKQPEDAEFHDRLISAWMFLGRLDRAAQAAEHKLEAVEPLAEHYVCAARIRMQLRDWRRAAAVLELGRARFPQDLHLRAARRPRTIVTLSIDAQS
jgi:tetratricopeptide (TPR) repeat protein